ncbi:hypothetical protein HG264_04250 [Pseudomonas sp. gcc21]|uniref:hypothetical protein n=1 Tax=Pseudomonas sp. gcc21 TaxID=2726989 RepID=UPI0014527BC6|nr:hypothetical protein [Pseudomonas sp. gcc21]QJD58183.1 hypothetical protein HG264_04250 [Pseudomonas sp. gcc21]
MKRSGPDFIQPLRMPCRCHECKGKGLTRGLFHELDCVTCAGVGWLPSAGQDITIELGRMLTHTLERARQLERAGQHASGPERDYQDTGRGGHRGHWTGD